MSYLARPSGLKPPSKVPKPQTSIPRPSSLQAAVKVEDGPHAENIKETVAKSARKAGLSPTDAANHAEKSVKVVPSSSSNSGSTSNGSKENFKIGDRVIVSGTKHGRIQFIGETQFAAGEWAGVVLDEPIGKNDGSVNGVRYFQCESKKGVFARPDKLVYESSTTNGARRSSTSGLMRPAGLPSAPRMGTKVASPRGTVSKDGKTPIGTSSLAQEDGDNTGLKVGDRVLVSGSKLGILRFVGPTEFAKGEWAGVELDEEMGKNDGAVAGTRYFQCRPKYGLFAPVHKVSKVHTQASNLVDSSRSRRSNSSSSLSSMGSRNYGLNASSGSIMTSKSSELRKMSTPQKSSIAKPTSSSTRRLSKLKRPEGKISRSSSQSSLLSEADSVDLNENVKDNKEERSNSGRSSVDLLSAPKGQKREGRLSRASSRSSVLSDTDSTSGLGDQELDRPEEAEHEIALLKLRHEKYVRDSEDNLETVKSLLESADREKVQILQQLEEERRKVEDYQFRLEEATINSSDMKAEYEGGSEKMKELEASLKVESDKATKFLQDIEDLKNQIENKDFKIAELETEMSTFTEQMEVMKKDLEESKQQNRRLETTQKDNDETTQQLELKVNRVSELEKIVAELQNTKAEQRSQLDKLEMTVKEERSSKEQADSSVQELQKKLSEKETSLDSHSSLLAETKSSLQDVERRLQASESKVEQLTEDKRKLEGDISELIKNSGNSSEQLSSMNEDLRAKDRRIEELQQELSEANQKISKISYQLGQTEEETKDKINRLEEKQEEEKTRHKKEKENLQAQLEESQSHAAAIQESSSATIQELRDQLNGQIDDLKKEIETKDAVLEQERRERKSLEERVYVAETEMKSAKEEKETSESNLRQISQDRDKLRGERDQALAERQKIMTEKTELVLKQEEVHLKHQTLMDQIEKESLARAESAKVSEDLKASLEKVTQERDAAMKERTEAMASFQENSMKLASKEQEVQNLKNELEKQREESQKATDLSKNGEVDTDRIRKQLTEANQEIESMKMLLAGMEQDKLDLEGQLQRLQAQNTEQREKLEKQLEEAKTSLGSTTEQSKAKEEEAANLRKSLDTATEKSQKAEEQINEMKAEMEQLRQQLETEKDNASKGETKIGGLEAILADTKQELEQKTGKLEDLDTSHKALSAELQSTQQAKVSLEEEVGSLKKQIDSYREQFAIAEKEGQSNQGILQAELVDTKQALDLSQTKVQRLEETEQTLLSQLATTKEQNDEMQKEMETLQRELNNSKLEYEVMQKTSEKNDADVSDLKIQLSETKQTLEQKEKKVSELEETVNKLQSDNSSKGDELQQLETNSSKLQQELDTAREELGKAQQGLTSMETLQKELSDLKKELDSERSKVTAIETEKVQMNENLQSLREKEATGVQQMMEENTTLSKELEDLKKKLEEEMSHFEEDKASMKQTIDATNGLVAEQEQQAEQYKQEISVLRAAVSDAGSQKEAIERLEGEKLLLEDKVSKLEVSLKDSMQHQTQNKLEKSPNPSELDEDGDPALVQLQEEKEMAEGQVNFLNSVIVDLQHKNDELRARLEAMENGYTLNGNMDHDLSDLDFEPSNHGPPPRLFCDICDVFDLHDTEDCPLQASSDSPPPSQHHGQRGEERPYCDTCEIFGHWTENCDDEQTY